MKLYNLIFISFLLTISELHCIKIQTSEINDDGLIFRVSFEDLYYCKNDLIVVKCEIINTSNDTILIGLNNYTNIDTLKYSLRGDDTDFSIYGVCGSSTSYGWHNVFSPFKFFNPSDSITYYIKFRINEVNSEIRSLSANIGFDFFKLHNSIKIFTEHYNTPGELSITREGSNDVAATSIGTMEDNEWIKYHYILPHLHRELITSINIKLSQNDKNSYEYKDPDDCEFFNEFLQQEKIQE